MPGSTSPLPRVIASQGTDHDKTWRAYAPLSWESLLPTLRAVGRLYLVVLLETWEPDPFLDIFSDGKWPLVLYHKKLIQNSVRPPRYKRGPETPTTYVWPSKRGIEGSTSVSEAYTLQVLSWSVPSEARTRGSSQVQCAKKTCVRKKKRFFRCQGCGTEREKRGPCVSFNTKGKTC